MAKSKNTVLRTANAQPAKEFFVTMLTRDISLEDCILDLVDNSVDEAWRRSRKTPNRLVINKDLEKFKIDIKFSDDDFSIIDNCGGMTLDDAADYAFTFGRREEQSSSPFSVGVYGIGMKRAVFKIGNDISIQSTYAENSVSKSYVVPIKVDEWLKSDERSWDFNIETASNLPSPGVKISVSELTEETHSRLSDPTYESHLRRVLRRTYLIPLMRGLTITLNGKHLDHVPLVLSQGSGFTPMNDTYSDSGVSVEIIAGMWKTPPNSSDPPREVRNTDITSGWYVICNGRVVLDADRSFLTGWGTDLCPSWHLQYSGFIGVILFNAKEPLLLPMTTTKRSVDVSSTIYQRALPRMQQPTQLWAKYTNQRKSDPEAAASVEGKTSSKDISALTKSSSLKLPTLKLRSQPNPVSIQFSVESTRVKKLAQAFGSRRLSNREVGRRAFDYSYEQLTEPDDE